MSEAVSGDAMVATLEPSGPFGQCASACFLFVGLFGDVLLIRFFLTLAYVFLLVGQDGIDGVGCSALFCSTLFTFH